MTSISKRIRKAEIISNLSFMLSIAFFISGNMAVGIMFILLCFTLSSWARAVRWWNRRV